MAGQFTLGKNERLKSRKLIEQLFNDGKSFTVQPYKIYYLLVDKTHNIQFAAGVSSKNFKRAVDRNRVKRITREAYRLQKKELQDVLEQKKLQLNIFFIYVGKELSDFNTTKEKVNVILNKLIKMLNESNS